VTRPSRYKNSGLLILALAFSAWTQSSFVSVVGHRLYLQDKPYTFVGTNYWYGSLLPLESDRRRGIERLRHELDFLKRHGVTNLRLMAGAEGSGPMNGVTRVGPPLQPEQGKFDETTLKGLDTLLAEMGKRKMKAVIFLSNNWEWSGGFQQYLIWNKVVGDDLLTRRPDWDELRDVVAKFYTCDACKAEYRRQVEFVITHTNTVTKKRYIDDPTIMAWELANEPRPMRPAANDAYAKWIEESGAYIKSLDHNHLVTTGSEGWIGLVSNKLFKDTHSAASIDYLTIHIWPKNWGWFSRDRSRSDREISIKERTRSYLAMDIADAAMLGKPLVIEEFGLPRDDQSLDPVSATTERDRYFAYILAYVGISTQVVGANFWAFGGTARPIVGQPFWKPDDDRMGDPPMEEQGLNSVFESDASTWRVIDKFTHR
jgi:mannan endo-1,4-beta-mannosidase